MLYNKSNMRMSRLREISKSNIDGGDSVSFSVNFDRHVPNKREYLETSFYRERSLHELRPQHRSPRVKLEEEPNPSLLKRIPFTM